MPRIGYFHIRLSLQSIYVSPTLVGWLCFLDVECISFLQPYNCMFLCWVVNTILAWVIHTVAVKLKLFCLCLCSDLHVLVIKLSEDYILRIMILETREAACKACVKWVDFCLFCWDILFFKHSFVYFILVLLLVPQNYGCSSDGAPCPISFGTGEP